MKFVHNLTIRASWTLVLLGFFSMLALLSMIGLLAVNHSQRNFNAFEAVNVHQQGTLNRANSMLLSARLDMARYYEEALEQGGTADAGPLAETGTALEEVTKVFAEFEALPRQAGHDALIEPIAASFDTLVSQVLQPQLHALQEGRLEAYRSLRDTAHTAYDDFYRDAVGFFHTVEAEGTARAGNFEWVVSATRKAIVAVFAAALIMIAVVFWGVTNNLIRPMEQLIKHFQEMERGNLGERIEVFGRNEITKLFATLRGMQTALRATVSQVRESSEAVFAGTSRIADANRDLSARTERQASALTQTASSMEEITATVQSNSRNASDASQAMARVAEQAEEGGHIVAGLVKQMHEVREGSERITDIIALIDQISFQTNILALNASVEAARAGEHGRGFAVVANEVRKLATRSADASAEIRTLIESSVDQARAGATGADKAGAAVEAIRQSVHDINHLMQEIANASREQEAGIGEINRAVSDMDETTQQNAAMVLQASESAEQLEGVASALREVVSRFRLEAQAHEAPLIDSPAPQASTPNAPARLPSMA
ncbi:MAG: methyl-accepting chemotaxis protein [Halomonas sp.]|nr:methyl-accepting chemotaxis protein [Halomonas sp.]MDX5501876.1 methyl-accepting chemotaxis protein [Halomonas sp.]